MALFAVASEIVFVLLPAVLYLGSKKFGDHETTLRIVTLTNVLMASDSLAAAIVYHLSLRAAIIDTSSIVRSSQRLVASVV